ncbi:TenA family protein [Leptolyngbya sp. AN02str]|uniref:TenA family protein n=1 Tax=Leptolyngbya sp. AN02str TaxID=3423363 RepID=UPI003D31F674
MNSQVWPGNFFLGHLLFGVVMRCAGESGGTILDIAEKLWRANQDVAIACLQHPFVQGIGNGTLAKSKFAYYVGQDAFFLEAFARAYSIAAAKTPDPEGFRVLYELTGGVLQELNLHQSYAAQWSVNLPLVDPGVATRQYTDFLSATAWSQEVGVTVAAMLPCMKLYRFLGVELSKDGLFDHAYGDWIRTYSSDEFEPLVQQLESLANRYTSLTPLVKETYRYAIECELAFFEGAWTI